MAQIQLLDTHTINKIAAGEVVDRPASVVKELVENSIDAAASSITIEIKNGGVDLIRITDNGKGIPKDEVEIAFLRHATSKITSAEDLVHVLSLGFRGEALASIGAVAKVELLTKTTNAMTGKRVDVEAGQILHSEEIACPAGTTIIMRQLFYNVPARRAFLKATSTETSKIAEVVYKLALAHPEVAIKYIQNNKLVFQTAGNYDLTRCVFSLYGKDTAKGTLELHYEEDGIQVSGLIGLPTLTRANRQYEQFFINGRTVKSNLLQKATEEAYKTFVTIGKFPFVILHLNLPPEEVDVNVHPTKLEVRFSDSERVYNVVYNGIRQHLQEKNLIPELKALNGPSAYKPAPIQATGDIKVESFFTKPQFQKSYNPSKLVDAPLKQKEDFEKGRTVYQPLFDQTLAVPTTVAEEAHALPDKTSTDCFAYTAPVIQTGNLTYSEIVKNVDKPVLTDSEGTPLVPLSGEQASLTTPQHLGIPESPTTSHILPDDSDIKTVQSTSQAPDTAAEAYKPVEGIDYKIIGQLFNTYWILEYGEQVLLMDQHSAHERVMYEQYMQDFTTSHVSTQILLMPETLYLPSQELLFVETHLDLLQRLGFGIELFGESSIIIREVPYLFNQPMSLTAFRDMLDSIDIKKTSNLYEMREEHIIQLSCKSAIKAHDQLSRVECKALIESLLILKNPYTCPHGRPTLVKLSKTDIEKIFKRIQ
ncbi:MAG: DNA mismatch repair endonuclease MutL [Niameybacter sp.]